MSSLTNSLGLPQERFSLANIHVGNAIHQEIAHLDTGIRVQYNSSTNKISVLNTSDLPPSMLEIILYGCPTSRIYDQWCCYPVIKQERDAEGNLEIDFSCRKPGSDTSKFSLLPVSGSTRVLSTSFLGLPQLKIISSREGFVSSGLMMASPSFLPHFPEPEVTVDLEEIKRVQKTISSSVIVTMSQFFNKRELMMGGIWYPDDYRKYLREEIDSEMDPSFFTGYAKCEFFEKTGRFTFKLKDGKNASDALMSFLEGPTVADCGNATMVCYYKSILDFLGTDKFNQIFGSNSSFPLIIGQRGITDSRAPISFFAEFTAASKQRKSGVLGKRPLQIGDECHFAGVIWYANKHPEGFGGGWNVIYIGDDGDGNQLFIAHGFEKPLTEKEINQQFIELYNKERTSQDEEHVINAKTPRLYDRGTNKYLRKHYTINPEQAEKNPERFIKGFLTGSVRNLNATYIAQLKKQI